MLTVTLIISGVFPPGLVVQASDRKLTAGTREFQRANKQIFISTSDAMTCIGYARYAHIRGVGTDDWLVARLLNLNSVDRGAGKPMSVVRRDGSHIDMGLRLNLLADELEAIAAKDSAFVLNIELVGQKRVRANSGLHLPYYANLRIAHGRASIFFSPKWHWLERRQLSWSCTGSGERVARRLLSNVDFGTATPSEIEESLASVIRQTSSQEPTVGSHAVILRVGSEEDADVVARYIPSPNLEGHDAATTYSPWIVLTRTASSPLAFNTGNYMYGDGPMLNPPPGALRAKLIGPPPSKHGGYLVQGYDPAPRHL